MSLRKTTLFVLLMTFIGLIVVLLGSLNAILPPYFQRQEKESVQLAALNGRAIIDNQLTELQQIGVYLLASIETYRAPSQNLVSNFADQTLMDFQVDLAVLYDPASGGLTGLWVGSDAVSSHEIPEEISLQLSAFVADPDTSVTVPGTAVLAVGQDALLLAVISANNNLDPSGRGVLFIGRLLDEQLLQELNAQYHLQMQIIPFGSVAAEDDYSYTREQLLQSDKPASMVLGSDLVAGYTLLKDLQGSPTFFTEVTQNRTIYQSSQIILNYLIISLVSSTAIFTLMIFLFVEYLVVGRLTRLNREVQKITASGDTARRTTLSGKDEIANLGRNINAMLAKLQDAQKQLELSYQQVKEGRKRLENLSHRLVDIQEEERRRIAIELHDEIGQSLTGLKLKLATLPSRQTSTQMEDLQKTQIILDDLIDRVRRLSLDLRPGMLDDLGLLPALLWYFEQYTSRTGIEIAFHHSGIQKRRFPNPVEIAAYRITQEGLTNIARHAGVKSAVVNVIRRESVMHLEILDTGIGFESEIVSKGSATTGLSGMRERISMLGGELKIRSKPGKGTKLQVDLPLDGRLERRKNARNHPAG